MTRCNTSSIEPVKLLRQFGNDQFYGFGLMQSETMLI